MLKHTDGLTTLDQELFPGLREEDDKKRWRLRKWVFVLMLSMVLVLCSGKFWLTSRKQATDLADQTSPQNAAQKQLIVRPSDAGWLGEWQAAISDAAKTLKAIPKGTLIPLRLTHEDLANLIGTTRETVTTQMIRFRRMGLVKRQDRFPLVNKSRLEEFGRS